MRDRTIERVGSILLAAAALLVVLRLLGGARWFELYGLATAGLLLLPWLAAVLWQGLGRRGQPRWLALLVVVPIGCMALVQIGFWLAFFSAPVTGIQLGMARQMLHLAGMGYVQLIALAWGLVALWVIWRAAFGRIDGDARS